MKRILFFFLITLFSIGVYAQPAWTKKATKAVFTLKTFKADGSLLGSASGFFTSADGEAVSAYEPFKGAARAVVIDAAGKEWPVSLMLGANATYDVARFKVDAKKAQPLEVAATRATVGQTLYLLPYREVKKVEQGICKKVENDNYYTLAMHASPEMACAPLINEAGQVVAVLQRPYAADTLCYGIGASFATGLSITGLSINDEALRATGIRKALPADFAQAQLSLYIAAGALDSLEYADYVDRFVEAFPEETDGYVSRARLHATALRYDAADEDMQKAVEKARQKDDAHFKYSQLICQKLLFQPEPAYAPWTFDKALSEAQAAYAANAMPIYRNQQAAVLAAQKKYAEAFAIYQELFATNLRSAELFSEAARCQQALGDTVAFVALLDSAVATFNRPYLKEAAPYLLARANARIDQARYREAVMDFNDYEELMRNQLNDNFYYVRYQAELSGRLFQQALDDINKAISLNPDNEFYLIDRASLNIRVGRYDDAISSARDCIARSEKHSEAWLFLGLAQCLKGDKAEGRVALQKAKELGNEQADSVIEKYAK